MRKDINLIRHLLLSIEDDEQYNAREKAKADSEFSEKYGGRCDDVVNEHYNLLVEAEYIEAIVSTRADGHRTYYPTRLTYAGTEYADAVRDSKVWRATKEKLSAVGSATLPLIQKIAVNIIESIIH